MCQQQLFWVLLVMADSPNRHNVAFQTLLNCLQLKQQCSEPDSSSSRSEATPLHQQLVQLLRASLHDEYVFQETCVAAIIAAVLSLHPDKQPGGMDFEFVLYHRCMLVHVGGAGWFSGFDLCRMICNDICAGVHMPKH